MPRAPRELATGESYHLTSRGVEKRNVFLDDRDRRRFVRRLGDAVEERPVSCLAYCLMDNHVHLVLHGDGPAISQVMRDVLGGHARFFNRRHERSGYLFGARFHHVHIASDAQMHAALRYVALNPVRAGLVSHPRDWPWSSFAALEARTVHPGAVDLALLGRLLGVESAAPADVASALCRTVEIGLADARLAANTK